MEKYATAKMIKLSKSLHSAVLSNNEEMVKLLLQSGADVNTRDSEGRTVLQKAFQIDVYTLLSRCGTYNTKDKGKDDQKQRIIDMLLRAGAEVNVQDVHGRTPLHKACLAGCQSTVAVLRRNGAKIGLIDRNGNTPLHYALHMPSNFDKKSSLIFELLAYNGAEGPKERSQHLINGPADEDILYALNVKDEGGWTPLHFASIRNNTYVVRLLLGMGAKVGVKDNDGMTALHRASLLSLVNVVGVLVDNGEDVNAEDCDGNTPIGLVCTYLSTYTLIKKELKLIDYLLNIGYMVHRGKYYLEIPYKLINSMNNLSDEVMKELEVTFIKHVVKLDMIKPQVGFNIKWKLGSDFYNSIRYQCCQEMEDMKTDIVKDVSVYSLLSRTNRPYPLSSDDILLIDEFLRSPDLLKRFPLYGLSLRTTFQRPKLLTLAVQSFYTERRKQMVKELPCEVTEQLLTYLTNEDLRNFIRSESCERVNSCLYRFNS